MKTFFRINIFAVLICICGLNVGCKKFVDVGAPVTSANVENIYNSDATAIAVLGGVYGNLARGSGTHFTQGVRSFSLLCGLSADEFTLWSGGSSNIIFNGYYTNNLFVSSGTNQVGNDYWNSLYSYVYACNSAIEGLQSSKSLTSSVRQQLLGEAKFVRAFMYIYLVNLFGDVPLVTSTDYSKNAILSRTSKEQVYQQIIADLKEAQELLSTDFLDANLKPYTGVKERVRPTKWAATALLSRVYLYTKNYAAAEEQATTLINNSSIFLLNALNDVFKKNSAEAIWQLQPVNSGFNTDDARMFVIPSTGFSNSVPVALSDFLLNKFEIGDNRKANGNWVNSIVISSKTYYYPYKYKVNLQNAGVTSASAMTEYLMVLRLGEQYLIRAEARAQLGKVSEGQSDLNQIRTRAGLVQLTGLNQASLVDAIQKERQVELFSEWGHRWFDLKRAGKVDEVMNVVTPVKSNGGTWKSYQQYYPVPFQELQRNPFMTQTTGY